MIKAHSVNEDASPSHITCGRKDEWGLSVFSYLEVNLARVWDYTPSSAHFPGSNAVRLTSAGMRRTVLTIG